MKTLSSQGYDVPVLGFGTWQLEQQECQDAVTHALKTGYRHIDTAQIYMNEAEVGHALASSHVHRNDIFLTTKIWRDNVSPELMEASFAGSLAKLRTDYVDMLLLHWPVDEVPLAEQLEALEAIKKSGRARQIGVSNYPTSLMRECQKLGAKISNNQVEYHPFIDQSPVLNYVRNHNMFLTAYCPLARGGVIQNPVIDKIAHKHQKSPAQVALRWLIQQGKVVAIPKSTSAKNIASNFNIFDFELSENEMQNIFNLAYPNGRLINPEWAPEWDTPKPQVA